jgi:hypothetical protein
MPVGRAWRVAAHGSIAWWALTSSVASAEPSKQECVDANEQAQSLRQQGSLTAARAQLAVCLAESCPGPVRQDCADRVAEIDRAMPSLVFEVKDAQGRDLSRVALRVDGKLVAARLDGTALSVDPGTHELTFVPRSGSNLQRTFVVHEGEKYRREPIVLYASDDDSGSRQRIAAVAVAGAGLAGIVAGAVLGFVSKSTYDDALSSDCRGNAHRCNSNGISSVNSAYAQATASTVGFIAGGALIAGGVALWATAHHQLRVEPTARGATLQLGVDF